MILFLYSTKDTNAIWLKNQLLGLVNGVEFVTISDYDLIHKAKIDLFISNIDQKFIINYNHKVVSSNDITKCINLIPFFDQSLFSIYTKVDIDYVNQEWHSIFLAILIIVKEKIIFNNPVPFEFCGRKIELDECLMSANMAGLNVFPLHRNKEGIHYFNELKSSVPFEILIYDSEIYCDQRIKNLMPLQVQNELVNFVKLLELKIIIIQLCYFQGKFYFYGTQNQYSFEIFPKEFLLNLKKNIFSLV